MTGISNVLLTASDIFTRIVVFVQVVGMVVLLVLHVRVISPRLRRLGDRVSRLGSILLVSLFVLYWWILTVLGMPGGLVMFWAQVVLILFFLDLILISLGRFFPRSYLQRLNTRIIRPTFFLWATLTLVNQFYPIAELAELPLFTLFKQDFTVGTALLCFLVPYYLIVLSPYPVSSLSFLLQKALGLSESTRRATDLVLRYLIVAFGLVWLLNYIGIDSTGLAAIAGGLSIGIGFGIRELVSNFVSGLWLLFEGSVRPGDVLYLEGDPCQVRSLGLRASVLWRQRDNAELVVPNQTFFTTTTTTYTGTDAMRRGEVIVSAAYRHDPEQVMLILLDAAKSVSKVLRQPQPSAFIAAYSSSSIDYSLRYFIADPLENLSVRTAVSEAVWKSFAASGIEIPFPQRVLHQAPDRTSKPSA